LTHDWSINNNRPASQFVFYYLMPLGVYWVGWQTRISERGLSVMFVLMGVFGAYLAITAVAERLELSAIVLPPYVLTSEFREFLGRGRGPLLNPAANGMLMGSCLGAGLMAWPNVPRWGKLLLIGCAALICLGIYCTMTRSAWMGGCLGLLILLLLVLPRYYRPWLLATVVLASAIVVATQWANIVEFKRDKNLTARETASSAELRGTLAAIAWEMFCDRPLLGCGLGHYLDEHGNYLTNRDIDIPLEQGRDYVQHNVWLSLLTETGLLGMTLFTLLMIVWLKNAWRLWKSCNAPLWMRQQGLFFLVVAANYVPNGMFQDMSIIPMVNMILFFLAGVTINLRLRAAEFESRTAAVSIRK
jgi:O-antigen ligase